jgi:hypothetical protein
VTVVHLLQTGIEKVATRATFVIRLLALEDLGDARPVETNYRRNPPETETFSA